MSELTVRHHHHLPDSSVIVHDHSERLGTIHKIIVFYGLPESARYARSSGQAVPECREPCVYRRYDE